MWYDQYASAIGYQGSWSPCYKQNEKNKNGRCNLVSARYWVTAAHIICVIWQRGGENRKLFIFPPEETATALQGVFVCVQLGLEVLRLSPEHNPDPNGFPTAGSSHNLSSSAAAWISLRAGVQPRRRLSVQPSFIADRHQWRLIVVLNLQ